jgi:uncharacterized protein (TIGR00725 family)
MDKMKRISVIGASCCSPTDYNIAKEVGRLIALRKAVLICGGLGGVMEAAARGAKEAGGITVGIIPTDNKKSVNPFIDIPIITGIGYARNIIVVLSAEVIIAVSGSVGTLSEIAFALRYKIPIIGINTWQLDKDYCPEADVTSASSAEEAVEKAFSLIG